MEDLSLKPFAFQQRVEACKALYLKYQGRHHDDIQREMRELGHATFNRRVLYERNQRGTRTLGWPERFGWNEELATDNTDKTDKKFQSVNGRPQPRIENTNRVAKKKAKSKQSVKSVANFLAWLKSISPEFKWDWKYQKYIYDKLEKVRTGQIKRLMVFVPPRHGKSELVTVRFAAWCLKHRPKMNIILGSYNQKLANRFSRKIKNVYVRALATDNTDKTDQDAVGIKETIPTHDAANCPKCIAKATACPNENRISTAEASPSVQSVQSVANSSSFQPRRIDTDAEWETTDGGGVRAVGVGAGITGFGGDLIIIDDPVKSRAEAESQTVRDNVWNWFNDDIYTRLEPDASIILIQTRWHEDDLAGRLLREMQEDPDAEQWEVIEFPAFAEPKPEKTAAATAAFGGDFEEIPAPKKQLYYILKGRRIPINTLGGLRPEFQHEEEAKKVDSGQLITDSRGKELSTINYQLSINKDWRDELGRKYGEPLCPERFPEKKLLQVKRKLGTYSFSALYQQRPTPAEGGFFKRYWFKIVDHAPQGLRWKRGYDLGISANVGSDYTATARVAFDRHGDLYIDRVYRQRWEYPEQRRAILGLIRTEPDTEHFIEQSANGNAVIQDLRREPSLRDRSFRGIVVKESKTARAFSWNALAEEGRVHLVRGAWNKDFIDEACSFPNGTHDDQIDAVSIAVKSQLHIRRAFHAF